MATVTQYANEFLVTHAAQGITPATAGLATLLAHEVLDTAWSAAIPELVQIANEIVESSHTPIIAATVGLGVGLCDEIFARPINEGDREKIINDLTYEQAQWFRARIDHAPNEPGLTPDATASYMGWSLKLAAAFNEGLTGLMLMMAWVKLLPSHTLNATIPLPGQFIGTPSVVTVTVADGMGDKSSFQLMMNPIKTPEEIIAYVNGILPLIDAIIEGQIVSATITTQIPLPGGLKASALPTADRAEKLKVIGFGRNRVKLESGHFTIPTIRPDVLALSPKSGIRRLDPVYVPEAQAFLQWFFDTESEFHYGQVGHARTYPANRWHGIEDVLTEMRFERLRRYRQ